MLETKEHQDNTTNCALKFDSDNYKFSQSSRQANNDLLTETHQSVLSQRTQNSVNTANQLVAASVKSGQQSMKQEPTVKQQLFQVVSSVGGDMALQQVSSPASRQQLAARVKSIKGKLLESHGAELRRTLFSLRQIFQDDSELANGFVEANGFECLLKVAKDGDQIQQSYILRAIGQLIAYPAGMNCLARHNETLQWLYTLLTAQHRLVVRTSLKLLLLFVGQQSNNNAGGGNKNASQLCAAIKQVDNSKGSRYGSHLIELFKPDITSNYSNSNLNSTSSKDNQQQQPEQIQDVSLLIDSMTLVNKTLDNIPQDQEDTYFDFIDALEQAGMESIIKKYSNLDAQLKEQFRLYEQKLASEEEEEDNEDEEEMEQQQVDSRPSGCKQQERVKFSPTTIEAAKRKEVSSARDEREFNQFNDDKQRELLSTSSSSTSITRNNNDDSTPAPIKQRQVEASNNISEKLKLPPLATASEFNTLDSGEPTSNDDNDYESANDESNEQVTVAAKLVCNKTDADDDESGRDESARDHSNGCSQIIVNNKLVQTVNEDHQQQHNINNRRHHLQLRSQPAPQYQRINNVMKQQNNLARGKQQRASISSCSSSDSYASYGSGYASGSGNSTDHEHKQQKQKSQTNSDTVDSSSSNNGNAVDSSDLTTLTTGIINLNIHTNKQRGAIAHEQDGESPIGGDTVGDDDTDNEENEDAHVSGAAADDENDDNDSQLKQHLSELEQLTDELAKRDILASANQAAQSTGKHYSSTIKSSSSNTSSVISTSSNISSLSSGINSGTSAKHQQQLATANTYQFGQSSAPTPPPLPRNNNSSTNDASANDSHSPSTTPTSGLQQATSNTTTSPKVYPYHNRKQQAQLDSSHDSMHTNLVRAANQYAKPSITNNGSPARNQQRTPSTAITSSTPTKQLPQESYYHNLFQWEQLVSKGVTRPLLINDLDFTDLRDEDDCDLLNSSNTNQVNGATPTRVGRNQATGEPLSISIPSAHQVASSADHDSVDSGASIGSPGSRSANEHLGTPATAPPPLPPPPISPWFNTVSGSRPQSQFMSSPSPPPFDFNASNGNLQQQPKEFNRDQSPAASTYSNYSRNSVCVTQQPPTSQQFSTLQPVGLRSASSMSSLLFGNSGKYANKRKKTMKLFWKEVREDRSLLARITKKKTIWDEIKPVQVDTSKLEYLFESKAKDLSLSKSRNGLDGSNQRKVKITVLDAKRSNAINIGMTKLPPMRTIKSAILKMDSSIMNREGIEKILTTMMPTEEEKSRIIEAQLANPDTPLGTAEQFLLNLASISALEARLKLWAFQLDYAQIEKEVAEPLMDLKQAIDEIERSETFRNILGTLLAIGNFLNSTSVKGFQIDYLEKVPEVKDTVHKHSLLHHLCLFIQEKFDPQLSSDLYSEFSAVNRASKVDYTEVAKSLKKMQQDCKASWDYLKIVAKHDGLANLMNTCGVSSPSSSEGSPNQHQQKPSGKLNNLSKLSMITTIIGSESPASSNDSQQAPATKQLKMKVSDFLTDCAERIMVLMVIHRRVMNRFQKLLVYLGCPLHQIKQTQPQQILKIINEFALEYKTKRERVREMLMRKQQCQHHHHHANRWQMNRMRWAGSQQCIDSLGYRPSSTASSCASSTFATNSLSTNCTDCTPSSRHHHTNGNHAGNRPNSPSGMSQISNYSDYLLDQSCCSRQESITPVPSLNGGVGRRPHSMSVSMLDLQQQQQQQQSKSANNSFTSNETNYAPHNSSLDENELARQKDEQLRRLLGAGKSLDEACHDLYQMSHWSSTMARINRHQHAPHKSRAASLAPWSHRNVEM